MCKPCIYVIPGSTTTSTASTSTRLHNYVSPVEPWWRVAERHCHNTRYTNSYATLESAKKACVALGYKCTGVYDDSCDDTGPHFLCKPGYIFERSSVGSCLYTPPCTYVCMFVCMYMCMYVCFYWWISGRRDGCVYVCVSVHICKWMCVHIYMQV